ncbi:MAG: FMN-binding negative transcriptional regulator [Paracoccaceae bacterium]
MHPNPIFHTESEARNVKYARERGFGVMAINGADGPLMAHIPFLLSEDGAVLECHLVRSNPIARALRAGSASTRVAVSGPDSYVSPDWYKADDQVPTWNYVAVHVWGTIELMPQDQLHDLLDRQSAHFEKMLEPKTPWTSSKMSEGVMESMMRQIVPCRMAVTKIDGTWKLNQNKPDAVRQNAADKVEAYGQGTDLSLLAALMRGA